MALPDFDEVADVVKSVSQGEEPRLIKKEQPINCAIIQILLISQLHCSAYQSQDIKININIKIITVFFYV